MLFWIVECDVIDFKLFYNLKFYQNKQTFKNKREQIEGKKEDKVTGNLKRKDRTLSTCLGLTIGPAGFWS